MHRLLIAASAAAFLAATAAPALADDYPPCSKTVTDKCKVVEMHMARHGHHAPPRHHPAPPHHHDDHK